MSVRRASTKLSTIQVHRSESYSSNRASCSIRAGHVDHKASVPKPRFFDSPMSSFNSYPITNRAARRSNRLSSLINGFKSSSKNSNIKVMRMPRSDYLKYFARDKNNLYVGSEPERMWTVEELDEEFGMYQDLPPPLWSMVESEGRIFLEDVGGWGEKEGLRSSYHDL
ncbi:hypothetical protein BKA64DRAFT_130836 [Cadophora sp. MPI-SDFR-AT-0126]|nr:hypothetical protein BKA64DRAFT_130836 [Leotiomycetes sp. MPI-SDFR-AT-0126]